MNVLSGKGMDGSWLLDSFFPLHWTSSECSCVFGV